ncbi:MAG: hypothetical protein M1281_00630 [Chloroflexi bacterium]|nr:hypothetical protein [Chloroflexota bacterium]
MDILSNHVLDLSYLKMQEFQQVAARERLAREAGQPGKSLRKVVGLWLYRLGSAMVAFGCWLQRSFGKQMGSPSSLVGTVTPRAS